MKNNIVIIEPSSAGIKLIDASLKLGNKVFLMTYNNKDRTIPKRYYDSCKIIEVDTNDEMKLNKEVQLLNSKLPIHAILPGFEYYVPSSARLNYSLGLKGLSPLTADSMHFKDKMRHHLKNCGIRMPNFIVVKSWEEVKKNVSKIKFPCVMKPAHLAGSLYITKLYNLDELEHHIKQLLGDDYLDMGYPMQGNILIEDYISGKEYSVEGYANNGKINYVSITDKFLSEEPYFIEVGHITRADIVPDVERILLEYTTSVVKALGINIGPFHCELRLNKDGPILIEIASRLVGDNISEIIELATGISLAEKMVKSYLDIPLLDKDLSHFKRYAGVRFIYGNSGTVFDRIEGVDQVVKMSGFHRFNLLTKPHEVIHPYTDFRARVAEVIFSGSTYNEVKLNLEKANGILKIKSKGDL